MKKFFSFLALLGLILASNCTEIPENNDPILGIWVRNDWIEQDTEKGRSRVTKEWIFNDVYLGRYQEFVDYQLVYYTDFSWKPDGNGYTVTYYGTETPPVNLHLTENEETQQLEYTDGGLFAQRGE